MAITLGAVTLPQGCVWSDEFAWSPLAQETTYTLTGSLVVEQTTRAAGRPITLVGGKEFAWLTRLQLTTLKALLDVGAEMTLTLHDARTFTVLPAGPDALQVSALPIVKDSGPANPSSGAWYVLEALKLIEV
ncbi:MAG: hypothetical protein MUC53_00115 [Candidatus Contendobacter sp.]|jgi:hypothetical protein|nr:hypothetical protein [Candidatus Contendobacter sp.]